jgi:hypothetical protein
MGHASDIFESTLFLARGLVLSIAWTVEDHGTIPEFEVEVLSAIDGVKI